jgi:hypothetical protein
MTYLLECYDERVALSVSQAPARCERLQAQGRLILTPSMACSRRLVMNSCGWCGKCSRGRWCGEDEEAEIVQGYRLLGKIEALLNKRAGCKP